MGTFVPILQVLFIGLATSAGSSGQCVNVVVGVYGFLLDLGSSPTLLSTLLLFALSNLIQAHLSIPGIEALLPEYSVRSMLRWTWWDLHPRPEHFSLGFIQQ
jgi:hypothetical protein